jgi:CRISPR-associated protein Cmr6
MTSSKPILKSQKSNAAATATNNIVIGGGNNRGGGDNNRGNNANGEPSPWLEHPLHPNGEPTRHTSASFVEYLRWMRSPNNDQKDATKTQILQIAQEGVDYRIILEKRNKNTRMIATARQGECLPVMCSWRIRVGGHRGPESILLPSFDALGVPYLPSSTLTGVARAAAIREFMEKDKGLSWKDAEKAIAPYFGSIEAKESKNKAGKVIFLDAYPTSSKSAGLAMDMANSIGQWKEDGSGLKPYNPNPNPFLSLKDVTFLIGICPMSNCDPTIFAKVKRWLIQGLQDGVGSQVNTGYGYIREQDSQNLPTGFLDFDFEVRGQLVHGSQKIDLDNPYYNGRLNQSPVEELRPIAIKSTLRYWFRAFALGKLPAIEVREIENKIFGGINPRHRGYISVHVYEDKKAHKPNAQKQGYPHGLQKGRLIVIRSQEPLETTISNFIDYEAAIQSLSKSLVWLMFHLGGVGLGARRPLYSRDRKNGRRPWWRGSSLTMLRNKFFGDSPKSSPEFKISFQEKVKELYAALNIISCKNLPSNLLSANNPTPDTWYEALDQHCSIFVMPNPVNKQANTSKAIQRGSSTITISGVKPSVLNTLHGIFHPLVDNYQQDRNSYDRELKKMALQNFTEAKNLCGHTDKDRIRIDGDFQERKAIASPIWISNLVDYQVVTVFGATHDPRKAFVKKLQDQGAVQIFPIA